MQNNLSLMFSSANWNGWEGIIDDNRIISFINNNTKNFLPISLSRLTWKTENPKSNELYIPTEEQYVVHICNNYTK